MGSPDCSAEVLPISSVQGSGPASAMAGTEVTIRGIITRIERGQGFYMQASESDPSPLASRGIFVSDPKHLLDTAKGKKVTLSGTVAELGQDVGGDGLTALVDISSHHFCGSADIPPPVESRLPMNSAQREALESMRVRFTQALTVTDVYSLDRGELILSGSGVLRIPTQIVDPGASARQYQQRNRDLSIPARLYSRDGAAFHAGATVGPFSAVMGHDGRSLHLLLDAEIDITPTPLESPAAPPANALRVAGMNLQNFFNGDGKGGGFPTERGQKTHVAFLAQTARIAAAVTAMQPDLLAVMELENDGFGQHSASASLRQALNSAGANDWSVVTTSQDKVGGDVISVGLFYRRSKLQAQGPALLLDGPEFTGLSRQPMAQLFRDRSSGVLMLIVVNHLKSKGRCPEEGENRDLGDGQGCWSAARVAAAEAMTSWAKAIAEDGGTSRILILGDMNAWLREDPIRTITEAGFVDLAEVFSPGDYSYLYRGEAGTLDYVFASTVLAGEVSSTTTWHINAAWPAHMNLAQPWLRSSDHDPVIVDLSFSQAATSD